MQRKVIFCKVMFFRHTLALYIISSPSSSSAKIIQWDRQKGISGVRSVSYSVQTCFARTHPRSGDDSYHCHLRRHHSHYCHHFIIFIIFMFAVIVIITSVIFSIILAAMAVNIIVDNNKNSKKPFYKEYFTTTQKQWHSLMRLGFLLTE